MMPLAVGDNSGENCKNNACIIHVSARHLHQNRPKLILAIPLPMHTI